MTAATIRDITAPAGVDPGRAFRACDSCRTLFLAMRIAGSACSRARTRILNTIHDQLMVEQLVAASGGGYDPTRIRAQISAIAEKALVDHLIIECDSKTHPIAFASLFLPDDGDGQRFSEIARLSSIVLAIDAEALVNSIVQGERVPGVTSPSILADQIECADVVVLNGEPASRNFLLAQAVTLGPQSAGASSDRLRETAAAAGHSKPRSTSRPRSPVLDGES